MADARPLVGSTQLLILPDADSLICGQSLVLAEQSVSLGTPASGYGIIYCKTDGNLYFKNDAGVETQLN